MKRQLEQCAELLEETRREIEQDRRQKLREEMKTKCSAIGPYVVETCIAYRQELDHLLNDVEALQAKNDELASQNKLLLLQLNQHITFQKNMLTTAQSTICSHCPHRLTCDGTLCAVCLTWLCSCCIASCSVMGCIIQVCKTCKKDTNKKCIQHCNEIREELGLEECTRRETYYRKHRYNNGWKYKEKDDEESD